MGDTSKDAGVETVEHGQVASEETSVSEENVQAGATFLGKLGQMVKKSFSSTEDEASAEKTEESDEEKVDELVDSIGKSFDATLEALKAQEFSEEQTVALKEKAGALRDALGAIAPVQKDESGADNEVAERFLKLVEQAVAKSAEASSDSISKSVKAHGEEVLMKGLQEVAGEVGKSHGELLKSFDGLRKRVEEIEETEGVSQTLPGQEDTAKSDDSPTADNPFKGVFGSTFQAVRTRARSKAGM